MGARSTEVVYISHPRYEWKGNQSFRNVLLRAPSHRWEGKGRGDFSSVTTMKRRGVCRWIVEGWIFLGGMSEDGMDGRRSDAVLSGSIYIIWVVRRLRDEGGGWALIRSKERQTLTSFVGTLMDEVEHTWSSGFDRLVWEWMRGFVFVFESLPFGFTVASKINMMSLNDDCSSVR